MSDVAVVTRAGAPPVPPPLSLYIHLPWCGSKCPYCDFNSHQAPAVLPEKEYASAVLRDLENTLPQVWGRRLLSVFIGGGTPSLFSAETIDRLLAGVRALFNLSPQAEVTLEANPDSADAIKFGEFRAAGVNRLSLGVQSFNDESLRRLSRLHNAAAAAAACEATARVFDNFNIDLMHALPGQNATMAKNDVIRAIAYAPTHLSLYQLTLEENTPFFRHPPSQLPDADTTADISESVARHAAAAGYRQYEVSAYAKNQRQCAHNMNYWQFGDYLGVGAGAHAKITENGCIYREQRIRHPKEYMRRSGDHPTANRHRVDGDDAVFEFFLNAMRLSDGVPVTLLTQRVGALNKGARDALQQAEKDGYLCRKDPTRLQPTQKGKRFLNDLTALFLPSSSVSGNNASTDIMHVRAKN